MRVPAGDAVGGRGRLPARPRPLAGECLPSWLARLAAANGVTAADVAEMAGGPPARMRGGRSEWDYVACGAGRCDPRLHALAGMTGLQVSAVAALSLRDLYVRLRARHADLGTDRPAARRQGLADGDAPAGRPAAYDHAFVARWPARWLPVQPGRATGGASGAGPGRTAYPYCPVCVATDAVPFFRRRWSVTYLAACVVHGVAFRDRCTRCAAPADLEPGAARVRPRTRRRGPSCVNSVTHCLACGAPRADAAGTPARFEVVAAAARAEAALRRGWGTLGRSAVPAGVYFEAVDHLVRWAARTGYRAPADGGAGAQAGVDVLPDDRADTVGAGPATWWSRLTPDERAPLLGVAERVLASAAAADLVAPNDWFDGWQGVRAGAARAADAWRRGTAVAPPVPAAAQPEAYLWGSAPNHESADPAQGALVLRPSSQRWYADYLHFFVAGRRQDAPPNA